MWSASRRSALGFDMVSVSQGPNPLVKEKDGQTITKGVHADGLRCRQHRDSFCEGRGVNVYSCGLETAGRVVSVGQSNLAQS